MGLVIVTGTESVAATPWVITGMVRSSSSVPLVSSAVAVALTPVSISPSVAAVPIRMSELAVWVALAKAE